MTSNHQLKQAIQQLAGTHLKDEVFVDVCTVTSVDVSTRTCTCTPITGPSTTGFINVRLMAAVDDGVLYIPTIGSTIIVCHTKHNQPLVLMYSQLDKMVFDAGSSTLQITDGSIQFNDGSFGGLTKTQELKAQLDKTNALLQALLTVINGTPIPEAGNGSPSGLQTALKAALSGQQLGDYSAIENTAVTHGV